MFQSFKISLSCDCPLACKEVMFKTKYTSSLDSNGIFIQIKYDSTMYTMIDELPAYPATKFVTDIGGWLGLFSGSSLLSLVELIVFTVLSLAGFCCKLKNFIRNRRLRRSENPSQA